MTVQTNKQADLYFFKREQADDIVAPYDGITRAQNIFTGVVGVNPIPTKNFQKYPKKTDVGFLARADASSDVSVQYSILLIAY